MAWDNQREAIYLIDAWQDLQIAMNESLPAYATDYLFYANNSAL